MIGFNVWTLLLQLIVIALGGGSSTRSPMTMMWERSLIISGDSQVTFVSATDIYRQKEVLSNSNVKAVILAENLERRSARRVLQLAAVQTQYEILLHYSSLNFYHDSYSNLLYHSVDGFNVFQRRLQTFLNARHLE